MKNSEPKKIAIIGFGRFGKTLLRLLSGDFEVIIYDKRKKATQDLNYKNNLEIAQNLDQAVSFADVIIPAVPIENLQPLLKSFKKISSSQLLIDVLSVKTYPQKLYKKYLPGVPALLTHPMFGPDSSKNGFENLTIMMDQNTASEYNFQFWKNYFLSKGLKVVEMSAKEHDKIVADGQAMTHMLGRVLSQFGFKQSEINTAGDKKILEVIEQTCNDSIELFYSMQNRNPYTRISRRHLQKAIDGVFRSVVGHRYKKRGIPIYGIQGGRGSFNDEAIHKYFLEKGITKYEVLYLHTTKRVLNHLDEKEIDFGLFAVSNSRGGIVEETTEELGKHKYEVVEIINIPIRHCILARGPIDKCKIKKIMAHPQVFKQCEHSLKKRYAGIALESGRGSAIDNAKIADLLSRGRLEPGTVVMGSYHLAQIYNLTVIDRDLQDDPHNTTNFILVK